MVLLVVVDVFWCDWSGREESGSVLAREKDVVGGEEEEEVWKWLRKEVFIGEGSQG
jgi:hypothetical protein